VEVLFAPDDRMNQPNRLNVQQLTRARGPDERPDE
jgi:hypothetical protein